MSTSALRTGTSGHGPARRWFSLAWLGRALSIRRDRQRLLGLDDHTLKDIGLSRSDVYEEAGRPFWDVDIRGRR